jgi:hypothetical protein
MEQLKALYQRQKGLDLELKMATDEMRANVVRPAITEVAEAIASLEATLSKAEVKAAKGE